MTDLFPGSLWAELQKYPLSMVESELCILIFLVLISGWKLRWLSARFAGWWPRLQGPAWRDVALVGVLALVLHAAALPFLRPPVPGVHDEFSFLLMSDTFASGRITNPPHPLAIFFETFHVILQPTYASMYPPAQGAALAAGQLVGTPMAGVWLSTALFCASLCWMLQAWVPRKWAFWGALLATVRIGIFSYWANTYWGGSVAAIGGCLVWGGLGRLRTRPRPSAAMWFAAGLIILATTRPYEGLWMSLAALAALAWILIRGRNFRLMTMTVAPMAAVLICGGIAMAYYNWRVFGNALTMPYSVNRQLYAVAPTFLWESPRPAPEYHHAVMRDFYTRIETGGFQSERTFYNYLLLTRLKLFTVWIFFLGPALLLPLVIAVIALRSPKSPMRWIAAGIGTTMIGIAIIGWPTNPHYYAPFTGCLYALLIDGFRRLRAWRRRDVMSGRKLALALGLGCVLVVPFRASADAFDVANVDNVTPVPWNAAELFPLRERARLMSKLRSMGGKHLVVVRYRPGHSPFQEYVFNDADIDASPVVWARELDKPAANLPLFRYYSNRKWWLFKADEGSLEAYPVPQGVSAANGLP